MLIRCKRSSLSKLTELSKSDQDNLFESNYDDDNQILIHSNTSANETAKQYPLPRAYTLKFLKELIRRVEESRNVVNESIYSSYIDLLNQKNDDGFHFVTYMVCGEEFTFKQSDKLVIDGTTGKFDLSDRCSLPEKFLVRESQNDLPLIFR